METKASIKNYYKPTPKKWRKLGDALIVAIPTVQGAIMGLDISLRAKAWIVLVISVILATGKFLTNFFADEPASEVNADNGV